jgi:hypothetical protein
MRHVVVDAPHLHVCHLMLSRSPIEVYQDRCPTDEICEPQKAALHMIYTGTVYLGSSFWRVPHLTHMI